MAYTDADLVALQRALASGELRVGYDGRDVTFRSIAELKEAIATVQGALDQASEAPSPRVVRTYAGKGTE